MSFVLYRKVSILRTTSNVLQRATSHGKVPFGLSLDGPLGSDLLERERSGGPVGWALVGNQGQIKGVAQVWI